MAIDPDLQNDIFQAMKQPDFYPHAVSDVIPVETHISCVFLTGEIVYKIKKAVNFGFLDFSDLEKRLDYCKQEVSLNRRLAPDVYIDVVPIIFRDGRYRLGEPADQGVEYAVKMRQLPDYRSMRYLLKTSGIDETAIRSLATVLAEFYSRAETGESVNGYGAWETIRDNCEENFQMIEAYAGELFDARTFQIVRAATRAFLHRRKSLFQDRIEQGKIRDCHGDLRADHIYFTENSIQIIDCIEFNQRFRYQDVACDLAFLIMDLDHEDHPEMARQFLDAYTDCSHDRDMVVILDFYKCYRAMVRCKVNCLRLREKTMTPEESKRRLEDTANYLELAYRYAERFTRPTLWVICGMPASGKSVVSAELSRILKIRAVNSDVVRKTLFGAQTDESADLPFESGMYSPGASSLTYGNLFLLAQEEIKKGNSVILDATFASHRRRAEAIRLAQDMDANIVFVECTASEAVLRERLAEREKAQPISDARLRHFDAFKKRFEPLNEVEKGFHILLDTGKSVEECIRRILSHDNLIPEPL